MQALPAVLCLTIALAAAAKYIFPAHPLAVSIHHTPTPPPPPPPHNAHRHMHARTHLHRPRVLTSVPPNSTCLQEQLTMPIGSSGGSTQALATMHRSSIGTDGHHRLLLQRMEPLFRPAPATDRDSRRLTRLLVNVTVDRSLWPVHVVLGADATVADLVRAAVAAYVREGRRPPLQTGNSDGDAADGFELHLNKYSLESLRLEEKVLDLGSRNFFLCERRSSAAAAAA